MHPVPCQSCGTPPLLTHDEDGYHLQCANLIDCPIWPATESLPTEQAAITAWNALNSPSPSPSDH